MRSEQLRVLIVTPLSPLRQGGVERHVREVSRRLVAGGVHVEVVCAEPGGGSLVEHEQDGVPIRTVRAWPANRDWLFAPRIWSEIGRDEWDLIHVQSYHTAVPPLGMLRALTLKVPYVVTFHGGGHTSSLRNRSRGAQLRVLRPLLARAARLVAVARFEIDLYARALRVPRERFALIPNGVELEAFEAVAGDGPADDEPVLASVGRLERYKGHHRVIEAMPRVLAARPRARLLIVGSGPFEAELRRCATELGIADRVTFTTAPAGDSAAMAAVLAGVSIVVLMSEYETHPLVGLEAAAARRRLLVADRGGLLELGRDGLARTIALHSSGLELGDAILKELAKPPPREAPPLTTWDDCAAELLALYRSVIAGAAGSGSR